MKRIMALILALACTAGTFSALAAVEGIYAGADAYVIFGDTIDSKNMKFFDGGQDNPDSLTYNEKVVLDGVEARKVYGRGPVNYVYLRMDENFYDVEEDHDFFIDICFYQFGPGPADFWFNYSSMKGSKSITIRKEAEVMWATKRIYITDANFNHSIDDVGADIKITSGAFNAFAYIYVVNASSLRNDSEFETGYASPEHAQSLYNIGLYVPEDDDYKKDLHTELTKAKAAKMIVKIIGKEDEISGCSTSMTGASGEESEALGYLEKNNYIDWSGDAKSTLTQEELVKVFAKIQGISTEGDVFDAAIAAGLIKNEDLILQPGKVAVENNLLCLGYNWLLLGDDSGEQNGNVLIEKDIIGEDSFDKYCYYEQYIDEYSGLPCEFFDLGTDGAERMYFTQSWWLKDGDAFVISDNAEKRLYKYTLATHKVEPLHGADILCNDVAITKDNMMYMRIQGGRESYRLDLDAPKYDEISAEVNADGTAFDGELIFNRSKGNYDKNIGFSGEDGLAQVDGKPYSYNVPFGDDSSQKWRNSWYFGIPDSFLYGTNSEKVEIEVEYYAPNGSGKVDIMVNDDNSKYTAPVVSNEWTSKVFTIKTNDGKDSVFCNGYDGVSDFKLMFEDCQAYVRKVVVRKYKNNIEYLGLRPRSSYMFHATNDGKFLSLNTDHGAEHTFEIYDVEKGTWSGELYEGEFVGPGRNTDHVMINPVYSNLIMFIHDGSIIDGADVDLDRIWLHDTKTGIYKNLYKQRTNMSNVTTGEKVGHEMWTFDGEDIVAVKYMEATNIGRSTLIRMNKYGKNVEYFNDDYRYWHCHASPDGRWIVADTQIDNQGRGRIVLTDTKTSKSYVIAYPKIHWQDPWQPHAQFSSDGKKVTFAETRRQIDGKTVYGVGIVDVSSIVEQDPLDEVYEGTNGRAGYRVSPFEINLSGEKSNEVTTTVENLDENVRNLALLAAIYDGNGKLISVDSSKCNTSSDVTLTTNFDWSEESKTLKCFVIDGDGNRAKTYPTAVEKLRAARTSKNNVVLSWIPNYNLIESKYEVFKNGVKIGETTDTVYRDSNLDDGTPFTYEVRPVFDKNVYMSKDDSCITVNPVYEDGKLTYEQSDDIIAPKARVNVTTDYKTVSYNLGTDAEKGLRLWSSKDITSESYTEKATVDNVACRMNTVQTVDDTTKTGMFYFRVDPNSISKRIRDVEITVKYYSYARGGGDIYLDYNADTGSNKTIKLASVSNRSMNGKWKTATVRLSDARFYTYDSLMRCDFRIRPTCGGVCISEVSVTNNHEEVTSDEQYVEWNTKKQNGLTLLAGGKDKDNCRYLSNSKEWLKFDVDDSYQQGENMNMAWVEISYLDVGNGEIYLEYNTSDPTAKADQKSHKPAEEVITCTNTGEIKTKKISMIDAAFSKMDGYDFRIGTNDSAYISNVKLLGY